MTGHVWMHPWHDDLTFFRSVDDAANAWSDYE